MEITIKTLDQARETRVMVEVNGARLYTDAEVGDAQASEAELVAGPLRVRIAELEGRLAARTRDLELVERQRDEAHERASRFEDEASLGRRQSITLGDELISEREHNNRLKLGNDELARTVTRLREELAEARVNLAVATEREAEMDRRRVAAWNRATELDRVNKGHVCVETCRPNAHVAFKGRRELDAMERELADARRAIDILSGQLGRVSGAVHGPDLQAAMRTTWETKNARAMRDAIQAVRDALGSPSLPASPGRATSQA